ncbi:LIM domain-containing protein [Colletotrichum orbiculare MAFF 240422]|uniref:LIM domain-containing protein n=1 Tax=Colletotrichum orbiculare (strain 104-T / ATCC 96160 / CBS 514.97 / LARS 414 / MAFF 240422) TaxID=1213857 RepID=A0A484FZC3_COLOR|nr:LIM domain-containing protein [Colletotrichum orbiculare MAFF 240422]
MDNKQFAAYLANLRTNRVARPGGARPQPPASTTRSKRPSHDQSTPEPFARSESPAVSSTSSADKAPRPGPIPASGSYSSRHSTSTTSGRDYYPASSTVPLKPSEVVPTATYMERGQRWMEKEEAVSLRQAMDDMRIKDNAASPPKDTVGSDRPEEGATSQDDDTRIYNAALDEASELVWRHQNGVVPNPNAPYRYKPHMRKNSYAHARTASTGRNSRDIGPSGLARDTPRSLSGSSTDSDGQSRRGRPSMAMSRDSFSKSATPGLTFTGRRRSSMKRNISGEVEKPFSGDQIWEEPESRKSRETVAASAKASSDLPLFDKPKNPQGQVRFAAGPPADRVAPWKPRSKVEIHRNPPSQSRNPQYTTNSSVVTPVRSDTVPKKNGMEIRSDDIREATSMRLKDRSAKLPTPTAVSDQLGRPIERLPASPSREPRTRKTSRLRAPSTKRPFQRPQRHWSPAAGSEHRSTTSCHECGFPIEGRFVSLAGLSERFHPQCFSCFACGTGLEALEISPEPDAHRHERLDRIRRRAAGEILEELPGKTAVDDGDERLRFYCHLDWHELYAPRCKHCKTPIIGEHVVALGEHWHYGHFFCAECGDPFEKGMTHIEKDGYAWCINCQTKRTERRAPKCKKCKIAVIGQYIRALGGEWHDECFRCASCQGGFDDGQIFPKEDGDRTIVLCTRCRMMELKA